MTEDRLLELLGQAFEAETDAASSEPPPERVDRFRRAVENHGRVGATPPPGRRSHAAPRRRWRFVAAAAAIVAFVAGLAIGHELPRPVRELAHTIGLPVDSPELVDTKDAVDQLAVAVAAGTAADLQGTLSEAEFDEIASADADMLALVGRLDNDERAEVVPTAHQVHLSAVRFFDDRDRALPTAKPGDYAELEAG
ncbi:MAG: hypothetical protein ACRD0U_12830 [Acidimicrobiales bacterium]